MLCLIGVAEGFNTSREQYQYMFLKILNNSSKSLSEALAYCNDFFKDFNVYADIVIEAKDSTTNSGGAFKKENGAYKIYLGLGERYLSGMDYGDIKKILVHEVQHVLYMEAGLPDIHALSWSNTVMSTLGLREVQDYFLQETRSPNFQPRNTDITLGVIHKTLGSFKSALSELTSPENKKSANFLISREGNVVELVPPNMAAWANGIISNPSKTFKTVALRNFYGGYVNPNLYSISIEFECLLNQDLTDEQIRKGREIFDRYSIRNIITHKDITDYKPDMSKDIIKFKIMYVKSSDKTDARRWKIENGKRFWVFDPSTVKNLGLTDNDFIEKEDIMTYPYGGAILVSNTDEPKK